MRYAKFVFKHVHIASVYLATHSGNSNNMKHQLGNATKKGN